MSEGETTVLSEYFAAPPAGSGPWTFSMDSVTVDGAPNFVGTVSDIEIPTN
jgi:hypothetical protein